MIDLLIATLAVFGVYEVIRPYLPTLLQPVSVYAGAGLWCFPDWRLGLAVAGAVGLMHVLVRDRVAVGTTTLQRASRFPRLP